MKTLIASLILAGCATLAHAAPASTESIERLLKLSGAANMAESMQQNIDPMLRTAMEGAAKDKTLTPEQKAAIDKMPERVAKLLREEMAWEKMKPQYVRIYQESFTQSEIDGLITFYSSPTGKAMLAKMPTVMQKSMALAQSQMQSLMPKLNALMQELNDVKNTGKQAKPSK